MVTALELEASSAALSWKLPKALKSLKALTPLHLGSGCAFRDKPSFEVLRHLPLQHLAFGHGSVVSAAYLLELISDDKKLASLTPLQLDNVYADLGEELSWRDQSSELSDFPGRLGVAARANGVELSGDATEAPDIEDEIVNSKEQVKGWFKREARRQRRGEYYGGGGGRRWNR